MTDHAGTELFVCTRGRSDIPKKKIQLMITEEAFNLLQKKAKKAGKMPMRYMEDELMKVAHK